MAVNLSKLADKLEGKYKMAKVVVTEAKKAHGDAIRKLEQLTEAQSTIQHIVQSIQQQAHDRVASVVTRCLSAVFLDPYEFRIVFDRKRGKTEARCVFVRNGMEIDPKNAAGGGVIDVAAFALRLSALLLSTPKKRRLLILDEPFRFLSAEYRPAVVELIERLAEETKVQFVLVTHSFEFMIGKTIHIGR